MSGWKIKGIAGALIVAALVVAAALWMNVGGAGGGASAQVPNDNETLAAIQDEIALVRSEVAGVSKEVGSAQESIGEVGGEVALTRNQVGRLARSLEMATDNPAVYTQAFVEAAISRYQTTGRDAAIAHYNTAESMNGQWYVFIIDENDMIISHAAIPENVGMDVKDIASADGWPTGRALVKAASAEGEWLSYYFDNPATGQLELKHSWLARHDGLIFGSGWYEKAPDPVSEPGAYTQLVVKRAIELHDALGRDAALNYYGSRQSVDGEWYVFAIENNRVISHPVDRTIIGRSLLGERGTDIRGKNFGAEMVQADESGAWVEYIFINRADGKHERKHSWVVKHDGIIYGSGWYEKNVDFQTDSAAFTRAYVEEAIRRYDADPDAALEYYNSDESVIGDWYMFIVDDKDVTVAHGNVPERVGGDIKERVAPNGYPHGRVISEAADSKGAWVTYVLESPTAPDEVRVKRALLVRHKGMIFGSGWYEPAPSKTADPAGYTKLYVEQAIQMHDVLGARAANSFYNSQASVDGDWYGSIIGTNNRLEAHPDPALRGRTTSSLTDASGYPIGRLLLRVPASGMWIEYDYSKPSGGIGAKHTWLVRHEGRIFSSGWYEAAPSKTSEPGAFTKRFVNKALQLYDVAGRDAAFRHYNSRRSVDGDWYLFVINRFGDIVVQGADPSLRGQSINGPLGTDSTGKNFGAEIMSADEDGMWVEYMFNNPTTRQPERKRSWVVKRDGLIFGAGWYDN